MPKKHTIPKLTTYLNNLVIPDISIKPLTFLDISGQPHYENVISSLYAFFFNVDAEHGFGDLFLKSLYEVLERKTNTIIEENKRLKVFTSDTEILTDMGGRIDILLANESQAILIENKIYHHIEDNNLQDYWNTITKERKKEECWGIVLSLYPVNYSHKEGAEHFINITHLEFVEQIKVNREGYVKHQTDKYDFFLDDFIQNIHNISTSNMNLEKIEFYKNQAKRVEEINKLINEVEKHIKTEFKKVDEYLNGFTNFNNGLKHYTVFANDNNPNLIFGFGLNKDELNNDVLDMIVEFQNEALKDREIFQQLVFDAKEENVIKPNGLSDKQANWAHYAHIPYTLTTEDLLNLGDFIIQKLKENPLESIMQKVEHLLDTQKAVEIE